MSQGSEQKHSQPTPREHVRAAEPKRRQDPGSPDVVGYASAPEMPVELSTASNPGGTSTEETGEQNRAEVEGHGLTPSGLDQSAHGGQAAEQADDSDGPEVEGHMHPILAEGMAESRRRDYMAEATRDRRAAEANQSPGVLDGIRDKIRRRGDNQG